MEQNMDQLLRKRCILLLANALVFNFLRSDVKAQNYGNIAVNKPTMQIDTYGKGVSSRANDGNVDGNGNYCSATKSKSATWWMVDLLATRTVYAVQIKNRNTNDYKILKDFYVYVSETNPLPLPPSDGNFQGEMCLFHPGFLPGNGLRFLPCLKPLRGRYVYVWKPGQNGLLRLCEVEVLSLPSRSYSYYLYKDTRNHVAPFHTETLNPGLGSCIQCIIVCLNLEGSSVNVMQFKHETSECFCFDTKPFVDDAHNISSFEGIDMLKVSF